MHLWASNEKLWRTVAGLTGQQATHQEVSKRESYGGSRRDHFTQEDPIGFAGGLNLYGFAAGDPVNFSDALGLCPPCWPDQPGFRKIQSTPSETAKGFAILAGVTVGLVAALAAPELAIASYRWLVPATAAAVSSAQAVANGVVREGGKLLPVLQNIEAEFAAANPKSAVEALDIIGKATRAVNLEPGVVTETLQDGTVKLSNFGATTTVSPNGSILVENAKGVALRLLPKE